MMGLGRLCFAGPLGGFGGIGMVAVMFLAGLLLVGFVAWLVYTTSRHAPATAVATTGTARVGTDEAIEIVRQRFARGEIDAEAYARLVEALTRIT